MKPRNIEEIMRWFKQNKKSPCTNCRQSNFSVSNKFSIMYQVDFDSPQLLPKLPDELHKTITVVCKNCGKIELYDTFTAGFSELLKNE